MSDQTPRVPDQPDGIDDYSFNLPDKERAAERVNEFLSWFGDGGIYLSVDHPPLYARDLQALTNAATVDAVRLVPEAASEIEWGWCPDPDEPGMVLAAVDEVAARERVNAARIRVLMRRTVAIGPWIEVTS